MGFIFVVLVIAALYGMGGIKYSRTTTRTSTGTYTITTKDGDTDAPTTSSLGFTVITTSRRVWPSEEEKEGEDKVEGEGKGDRDGPIAVRCKHIWHVHWGKGDVQSQESGTKDNSTERGVRKD